MTSPRELVLLCALVMAALMAGLFFAWSCAVTMGLGRLEDGPYLAAFQSINRAILNPLFFAVFFGAALALPLSAWLYYDHASRLCFWFLAGAAACYLVGVMGVTIAGNVPLNDTLDAFSLEGASASAMRIQRAAFEHRWNMLNNVRTIASTLAVVLLGLALLQRGALT